MDGFFNIMWCGFPLNSETHVSSIIIPYVGPSSCSEKKGMAWNVFEPSMPIK
jgi:hypothetical protein